MGKYRLFDIVQLIADQRVGGVLFPARTPMTVVDVYTSPEGYTLDCEDVKDCITVGPELIEPA